MNSKVAASSGAAGGSSPFAIILIWVLTDLLGLKMPPEVAAAIAGVISGVAAAVAGYMTKLETQVITSEEKPHA
jgi:hypothetical protein